MTTRLATRLRRVGLTAAALACLSTAAAAQFPEPAPSRDVGVAAAFGCNVLLGGLTAATRAWIGGHDPVRAFAIGALGGAVHFGGKIVGPGTSLAGVALGATGTAIVGNAGRGVSPLNELYVPVGPLRLRITPRASRRVRVTLHAYDAAILVRNLARSGLAMDWGLTASSGTVFLRTENRRITYDGREAHGLAIGSLLVMSDFASEPGRVEAHELVHAHQYWFLDEAIGRPVEGYLRRVVPGARRLPGWLELGIVPPGLAVLESMLFGRPGPVGRLVESEADLVDRCC